MIEIKPEVDRNQLEAELQKLEQQLLELSTKHNIPISELDKRLQELRRRVEQLQEQIKSQVTPMDRVRNARHPDRPYTLDYIKLLCEDFQELAGDRRYGNDPAIVCGMAKFRKRPVIIVGHQKANLNSRKTEDRKMRNFGMPKPEGYRKALRVMKLAEKFNRAIITFIDTPGAYPGIDAEERGQAEAIARNLIEMARISVPIVVIVTGEGGSGGALAIGVGDVIYILENAIYSVISPEGCAAILWKDAAKAELAAQSMKLTASELKELGIVDDIIPEPKGGAHLDHKQTAETVAEYIDKALKFLDSLSVQERLLRRYEKFRKIGSFELL
ncbi:MAG: acetyl-CoA carboxylase carboxyltransferase subunit alpha [Acidobacteriota bacterium]|nr:acetyl-CoA carboxylase carboxyltransferase subunit alpha [Blastocatellia bacterium]MDW8411363.1 acetyl-CoA carboxylase carboxyltransferase subunit alpha [Acidobacteriota bacterium]